MNRNHDPWCHEPTSKWLFTESWREGHREPSTPLYSASSEDSHRLSAYVRAQSCPTLCDPMDCCPPGSPVSGIFQARILEWVAISYSRGSSWPRVGSNLHLLSSYIGRQIVYLFATWEAPHTDCCCCCCYVTSVVSNSVRSHRGQPTRLLCPWDSQARVMEWVAISLSNACMPAKLLQSYATLWDPMDSSPPGSSVHRILYARMLKWVAFSFSIIQTSVEQLQAVSAPGLDSVVIGTGKLSSQHQSSPQSGWKVCSGPQVRPPKKLHTIILLC